MGEYTVSDTVLDRLLEPSLERLAARLGSVAGLAETERRAVLTGAATALLNTVRMRTNRVLLLELNAARITGRLTGADPEARWRDWESQAANPEFWESLGGHYPTLLPRLRRLIGHRCAAAMSLACRFAADRPLLTTLLRPLEGGEPGQAKGGDPGELVSVEFGAGDSHRGGQSVAILTCAAGKVVYKPRSVAVDLAAARLLSRLLADEPADTRIRVPDVVSGDGYGWAEHVAHRYCADDEEMRCFYRNLGHWLAVMRLIGGTDLHAENLIAAGPIPTVVDCETLFTPQPPTRVSGYGLAADRAGALIGGSVLGTGLLPGRGLALGWRGVDMSAIGSLPGQQPVTELPVILGVGTDEARIGLAPVRVPLSLNHPSPEPVLSKHWDLVVDGFTRLTGRLRKLDEGGELAGWLGEFADLPIRVVLRSTESYAELQRMLWHPHSLHDEPAARRRAADLLARQAANAPGRPDDPEVIEAEVEELLDGDVPFFATTPRRGRLTGPRGTQWGPVQDLIAGTLGRWRSADLALEHQVIQSALVSAYLNEGGVPDQRRLLPAVLNTDDLDRRRRALAADIMRSLSDAAVRAEDGTVTWIAPVLNPTGWAVLPLGLDMYGGAAGIAVLLAGYLREMEAGRADPVPDVGQLLADVLRTVRMAEEQWAKDRAEIKTRRPAPAGGYLGLASRIWGWLLLVRLGVIEPAEAFSRSADLVRELPAALDSDPSLDLVRGMAGAVVPLLRLHESAGNADAGDLARTIGRKLVSAAQVRGDTACWTIDGFPDGIGGLAHGATGIGWALSRLAAATGDTDCASVAEAAFAYEETLYVPETGSWRDLRGPDQIGAAWCHGSVGIAVVAADQLMEGRGDPERLRDLLRRAAQSSQADGIGWNHTLCHGDFGAWEVLDLAVTAGLGAGGLDRPRLEAHLLGSVEEHGPVSGFARDAFVPGLMPGLGGVAYQLLRMHPECPLPSVLLPDPGPVSSTVKPS
ncbi:type 2 lanthipeptide synthetase LanM family protein [Nonomuraea sp. NPDC048901]|uniref:type 2 lanthipeptide synthetase LanM family protein n=1 Tax=Nonomuraea sp. NPDC048901 TaxID=3155627 RepID=UPI0033CEF707